MPNITRNTFAAKIYDFAARVSWAWRGDKNSYHLENKNRTNLCTYIRRVFVTMPLAILTTLATYLYLIFTFIAFPAYVGGIIYAYVIGGLALSITIVAGLIGWYIVWKEKKGKVTFKEMKNKLEDDYEKKRDGFFSLIWKHIKARHDKICLNVTIGD